MPADTLLADLPGFPPDFYADWTLGKLRARTVMVAQFDMGRFTFEEALFKAFGGLEVATDCWSGWDEEMREYVAECNRLATAASDAVLGYLGEEGRGGLFRLADPGGPAAGG